mmetsp:Transcript_29007/g.87069  ORF Transcript_29007/g.87069 Transcript_29007/m.87069 type:complete len:230 (+) Transcript_29007:246-935(+)
MRWSMPSGCAWHALDAQDSTVRDAPLLQLEPDASRTSSSTRPGLMSRAAIPQIHKIREIDATFWLVPMSSLLGTILRRFMAAVVGRDGTDRRHQGASETPRLCKTPLQRATAPSDAPDLTEHGVGIQASAKTATRTFSFTRRRFTSLVAGDKTRRVIAATSSVKLPKCGALPPLWRPPYDQRPPPPWHQRLYRRQPLQPERRQRQHPRFTRVTTGPIPATCSQRSAART